MSHIHVQRVIGLLVTDEGFRHRFAENPEAALRTLFATGVELTPCELNALLTMDCQQLARFADSIDPRLQKIDLEGEGEVR